MPRLETEERLAHRQRREQLSFVGRFERLPREIITDIVINQSMQRLATDPNLRKWLDPDYLLEHAALFAIGKTDEGLKRIQAPSMHRGVLLQIGRPIEDEFGFIYSAVGGKGNGLTEYGMEKRKSFLAGSYNSRDPNGFFGFSHGQQEMEISDGFAKLGGRNGRVVANLRLDHTKLRDWYDQQNGATFPLHKMLNIVGYNGDAAGICVRLFGVEREQDVIDAKYVAYHTRYIVDEGVFTPENMARRAAKLILWEMERRGEKNFFEFYELGQDKPFREDLTKILQGQNDVESLFTLVYLQKFFFHRNAEIKYALSQQKYNGQLRLSLKEQDEDLAGFWYDWEQSLPGKQYLSENEDEKEIPTGNAHLYPILQRAPYSLSKNNAELIVVKKIPEIEKEAKAAVVY